MLGLYWTPRPLEGKNNKNKVESLFREIKNKGDKISLETQREHFLAVV